MRSSELPRYFEFILFFIVAPGTAAIALKLKNPRSQKVPRAFTILTIGFRFWKAGRGTAARFIFLGYHHDSASTKKIIREIPHKYRLRRGWILGVRINFMKSIFPLAVHHPGRVCPFFVTKFIAIFNPLSNLAALVWISGNSKNSKSENCNTLRFEY